MAIIIKATAQGYALIVNGRAELLAVSFVAALSHAQSLIKCELTGA